MKIKEILIERYGPLPRNRFEFVDGANLIYGPNGSGKSLIIESIFKFLSGRGCCFDEEDRIAEEPEGFVVIKKDEEEIKLERDQTIQEVFELNIEPTEIKNLFFVKDSELFFEDETGFYEKLTDKILGIRTKDLEKIKKELELNGRLTIGGNVSDDSKLGKPKTQLKKASNLIKEIIEYIKYTKKYRLDDAEKNKFNIESERIELREKIELMRKAEEINEFNNLNEKIKTIGKFVGEIEKLPDKKRIQYYSKLSKEISDSEEKLPKELLIRKLKQIKQVNLFSFIAFVVLLTITTIVSIYNTSVFIYGSISSSLLLLISLASFLYFTQLNKKISAKDRLEEKIKVEIIREFDIHFKTTLEITKFLEDIDERRKVLRDNFMRNISIFEEKFELQDLDMKSETMELIKDKLEEFRKTIDFEVEIEYSEEEHERIRQRLTESDDELDKYIAELNEHRDSLTEFDKNINKIDCEGFIGEIFEIRIDSIDALNKAIPLLERVVLEIEQKANLAMNVIEIFDVIEKEESEKKEELFKDNEFLLETIQQITDGYLVSIDYISSEDEIIVEKRNGTRLNIEQLSCGEWTQVLFAIRISLAYKYLGEQKGFFIFENPFQSSDDERLNLQLELINTIAEEGWQIIFFSSKNHIVNFFENSIGEENIYRIERL